MGQCCSGSAPVVPIASPLDAQLSVMETRAAGPTCLVSLLDSAPPYSPKSSTTSEDLYVHGKRARYVGIGQLESGSGKTWLVSDSYAPCVPVIFFHRDGTWLGHSLGDSLQHLVRKHWAELLGAQVYIIRKTRHPANVAAADSLRKILEGLSFEVTNWDLRTSRTIGVIVRGATNQVLVYAHPGL